MNHGLIGTWSPGIGDPSVGGWLTVALYFGAAALVWGLLRRWPHWSSGQEAWFWKLLLIALVLLGINKQLDLQSAFTETARLLAVKQGWYAERRQARERRRKRDEERHDDQRPGRCAFPEKPGGEQRDHAEEHCHARRHPAAR